MIIGEGSMLFYDQQKSCLFLLLAFVFFMVGTNGFAETVSNEIGTGDLEVLCNRTEADVFLNGELKGQTPGFILRGLEPGEYVLTVIKEGYEHVRRTVRIKPGKTLSLKLKLVPEEPEQPAERTSPDTSPFLPPGTDEPAMEVEEFRSEEEFYRERKIKAELLRGEIEIQRSRDNTANILIGVGVTLGVVGAIASAIQAQTEAEEEAEETGEPQTALVVAWGVLAAVPLIGGGVYLKVSANNEISRLKNKIRQLSQSQTRGGRLALSIGVDF
jgi:PEGA domain